MTPGATYRLQLRPEFGFDEAAAVLPYLAALGVDHVYCSPYLQAAPGSTHGYDVVDPTRVNAELGGAEAHARFCEALAGAGLGQVLDIVPNHMATAPANPWWWDVLEHGRASRYAAHFDIDWDPPEDRLRNRILVPILPDQYGRVLEAGAIQVTFGSGGGPGAGPGGGFAVQFADWRFPLAPGSWEGLVPDGAAGPALHEALEALNRDPDALDVLLERQHYRLAWWRTANEVLDYRRFFDVNTLVALRVEDEAVFVDTHGVVAGWLADGTLAGVRVDHPDGLRDPATYFERLRAAGPGTWLVIEKILEPGERLAPGWDVDGTTGYDVLNLVGGLFVDPAGEAPLTDLYVELSGDGRTFEEIAHEAKHQVLVQVLASDLHRLTQAAVRVCEGHRRHRDHTRSALRAALAELLACLPVYRTYGGAGPHDADVVARAVKSAANRRPDLDPELLALLEDVLLGRATGSIEAELRARFEQLSGPATAKGVEDTAFYRYGRLVALNEVGGAPDRFGVAVDEFHRECQWLAEHWPRTMTTLSTHDTKRSEDVRARLFVLTEAPERWAAFARRWLDEATSGRGVDAGTRYFLLQNLVGAWPLAEDRMQAYAEKTVREAKVRTSWTDPDAEYESAVHAWLAGRYADPEFCAAVDAFVASLEPAAATNSLAQKLVQLTMPGVPDTYQGCELEDRSLVDPDNRRPVDWDERRGLLALPDDRLAEAAPKLLVARTALGLRRRVGDLGGYTPLPCPEGTLAFLRGEGVAVAVPVRGARVAPEVDLPGGASAWRDLLPGLAVRLLERVR